MKEYFTAARDGKQGWASQDETGPIYILWSAPSSSSSPPLLAVVEKATCPAQLDKKKRPLPTTLVRGLDDDRLSCWEKVGLIPILKESLNKTKPNSRLWLCRFATSFNQFQCAYILRRSSSESYSLEYFLQKKVAISALSSQSLCSSLIPFSRGPICNSFFRKWKSKQKEKSLNRLWAWT